MGWIKQAKMAFRNEINRKVAKGALWDWAIREEHNRSRIPLAILTDWYTSGGRTIPPRGSRLCDVCGKPTRTRIYITKAGERREHAESKCNSCRHKIRRAKKKRGSDEKV
jgi:hypothetical protein